MLLRFRANAAKKKGEFGFFQQKNDAALKNTIDKILKYLADENCLPAKLSALIREAIKEFKNEITKNLKDLYSALGNQIDLEKSLENKVEELFDKIVKKAIKNKNYHYFLEEMLDEAFTSDNITFIEKILSDPIDLIAFAKLFHEKHLDINNELYRAAQQGCVNYFDMLLKNKKADVNYVSPGTDLAILFACVEAAIKIIFQHYSLTSFPDVNMDEQQLKDKLSPYAKIIEKLINLGADPLWVDKNGRSCLLRLESIC